jgi:hypothetical protein
MFANSTSNISSSVSSDISSDITSGDASKPCFKEKPRLSNQELLESLTMQVRKERELTASIIDLIREVSARRLYLEFGYTSMFEFLVKQMGYSEGAAQRRWDAARMLTQIPELRRDLTEGSVNLSQIAVLAQGVRQAEKEQGHKISTETKRKVLEKLRDQALQDTKLIVAQALDISVQGKERQRIQKDESVRCEFTLTKEEMSEVEKAKEFLSHILPGASLKEIFLQAVRELNQRRDPARPSRRKKPVEKGAGHFGETRPQTESTNAAEKFTATAAVNTVANTLSAEENLTATAAVSTDAHISAAAKPDAQKPMAAPAAVQNLSAQINPDPKSAPKSVPRAVRGQVFARDKHCQWQDSQTGKRCSSRHQLEVDHRRPQWAGGEHTIENLQILCGVHNRQKYHQETGLRFKGFST